MKRHKNIGSKKSRAEPLGKEGAATMENITDPPPGVVLVDFESVTELDATAINTIRGLNKELELDGIDLCLARVRTHVLDLMRSADLVEDIGPEHIYESVDAGAVAAGRGKGTGKLSRSTTAGSYELMEQNSSGREFEVTDGENGDVWSSPAPCNNKPTTNLVNH